MAKRGDVSLVSAAAGIRKAVMAIARIMVDSYGRCEAAELVDENGVVVATFNETCHDYGTTFATVRLRAPLAPFTLKGTELLAIYAVILHGIRTPLWSAPLRVDRLA
jgi:hypothetical protein